MKVGHEPLILAGPCRSTQTRVSWGYVPLILLFMSEHKRFILAMSICNCTSTSTSMSYLINSA